MREIVLDTETTGLDPAAGHRIVELGCLELFNRVPTGERFHSYLNPERDMPDEAFRIHGLSQEFLAQHPPFAEIAEAFLAFLGDTPVVMHNAEFDLSFLNAEFAKAGLPVLDRGRAIDTVAMARRRFPGAQVNLDALCRRFEIDNSARSLHGALLDCELLAEVYLELSGGRQPGLDLTESAAAAAATRAKRLPRAPRPHVPSSEELEAHAALVGTLKDPIWRSG